MELNPRSRWPATARFGSEANGVFSRVEALLPDDVQRADNGSLVRPASLPSKGTVLHQVAATLQVAQRLISQLAGGPYQPIDTVRIEAVPETPVDALKNGLQAIHWTQVEQLSVPVQPASTQINMSANKTCFLVGMAGDPGQSVARWMVTRGARNLVLTSRSFKVEGSWLNEMAKLGARVTPMAAMDVTDRESILRVDRGIRRQMPPVGRVVNGAMVLTDGMFAELPLEKIQAMFKPKVEGSLILDELYRDTDLNFFILFGSLVGIIDNWSQSAYTATTSFLPSLIHQRHQQSLVGSVIHPAEVRGVGYVPHIGRAVSQHMTNTLGTNVVSERDLHELGIDVPVLQILGGSSVEDIANNSVVKYLQEGF